MKQGHSCATPVCPGHCRRVSGHFVLHPLAFALACLVMPEWALALPEGFNPVSGLVNQNLATPGVMNLQQGTDRAIVNWNSFSIGPTESVNISQPNASSAMLNRVTGGVSSSIAGSLTANGRVFLVNPSGVVFGAGSRVSTGGLVASTLDISDDDFNNGRWNFSRADGNQAAVINRGDLQAGPGGTVALLGAVVRNEGSIKADGGTAALVSARQLSLDFQGDGLTTFRIDPANPASQALVQNASTGVVQADGGRVAILADASSTAQLVVNQEGVLRARSLVQREGEIILGVGSDDRAQVGGLLDASGGAGLKGGKVSIGGGGLYLNDQAVVDVGGAAGGGRVDVVAAQSAALAKGSRLDADARTDGKGGTLNLQGGSSLRAHGTLQARGAGSGAGGFIETSAQAVDLAGLTVQASGAPGQLAGTWLIDPFDITVAHGTGEEDVCCVLDAPFDVATENSTVFDGTISDALDSGSDVRIRTGLASSEEPGGSIRINDGVYILRSEGEENLTLSFEANESISSGRFIIRSNSAPLNVIFNANISGLADSGARISLENTGSPDIDVDDNGGDESRSLISTHGGNVSIFGGERITESEHASEADPLIRLFNLDIDTTGATPASSGSLFVRGYSIDDDALEMDTMSIHVGDGNVLLDGFGPGNFGLLLLDTEVYTDKGSVSIFGMGEDGLEISRGIVSTVDGSVEVTGDLGEEGEGVGVSIVDGNITTKHGSVSLVGKALLGAAGIVIDGAKISSDSGSIYLYGVAGEDDGDAVAPRSGLVLHGGTNISTNTGNIDLLGRVSSGEDGAGLLFDLDGSEIRVTSSSGNINLAGEAANGGTNSGILVNASLSEAIGTVSAGNRLDIRAASDNPDQLAFDIGNLSLVGKVQTSLHPGGVDDGELVDINSTPIQLGDGPDGFTPVSNFVVSQATIDRLTTPRLVIGSDEQSEPITGVGRITVDSDTQLTLQAEGEGGSIDLRAPLTVTNGTLSLLADGQISQSSTGILTSEQLLAISHNGNVLLNNPANAPHVIAGRAAGDFSFTNVDDLSIGTVEGTSGIQAGTVSINTLEGKLSVDQAVTATAGSAVLDSAVTLDVNAPVSVANGTLVLLANGQINQSGTGALTSEQLLAISRNGSVLLNNTANASHVLAGSAAQSFAFTGAGNLNIGTVGGTSGLQAGTVSLRNLAGDLSLDQAVTATGGTATLDSAGSLNISAPVSSANGTLTLAADGQINQNDAGTLTSAQLLAISRNGSVLLNNPANTSHIVAGSAAQAFAFTGAGNLNVGTVGGTSGVQAGTVALRNLAGDMSLDQAVTASAGRAVLDSAGAMAVNAPVSVPNGTLSLTANGQISQTDSGAMTSEQLLAVSRNASVLLNNPANAPHVVAGRAAGDFAFTNADNLSIGTVDGVSGVQAGSVFIRNLDGDLTLDQPVTATSGSAVLVTGGRLQNPSGQTISASTFWQIWANTWIGENRGGLVGSGRLPNLYGCAFGGNCASAAGLATTAGDNHFLYLQQPTAQVTIASGSGTFGVVPQFRSSISGLILGDSGNGISGSPDSAFSQVARPGTFSVGGTYTSAEGYLLTVVPGTWTNYLVGAVDARPDWTRERPDTWLYDHNMGGSPMCAAPGVDVASAVQQGDVLAREWSLVKSRPKLSSCVASDKQNGCSDF